MTRTRVIAMMAMLVVLPTLSRAWETTIGSGLINDGGSAIAQAGSRLFTGGSLSGGTASPNFAVVALDATTGAEVWRFVIDGGRVWQLALDAAGDVIALGLSTLVKLDGATGTQIWRRDFPDPFTGQSIAVDSAGDVIVAGGDHDVPGGDALLKLDGATGTDVWQLATCSTDLVAVDAMGDVFSTSIGITPEICKTDGATGTSLWTQAIPQRATDLAVDSLGDVVLTGGDGFRVRKLSGSTGALQWQYSSSLLFNSSANTVAVDSADDVIAGGLIQFLIGRDSVVKLDGASGAEVWRSGDREIYDLAVTTAGNVVGGMYDAVALFRGSTGALLWFSKGGATLVLDANDQVSSIPKGLYGWSVVKTGGPLTGRTLTVTETPAGTKLALKVKDQAILVTGTNNMLSPVLVGAVLELRNPSTDESDTISLPAANWTNAGRGVNFKYTDRDGVDGPCRKAKITQKVLKVSCKGSIFTLDEPTQGSLRATFVLGGEPLARQCAEFGGTLRIDAPGVFKAKNAPPPPLCP